MGFLANRGPFLAAAGMVATVLTGCSSMTYGTGTSPGKQTFNDITGLVSLGGTKQPKIDYASRPPIVAPPKAAALPEPGATTSVATNWPRDPDEIARARKDAEADAPREDPGVAALKDPGWRLPPGAEKTVNERRDPNMTAAIEAAKPVRDQNERAKKMIAAAKTGAAGKVDANGNPIRTTLTEPPADYRQPDPTSPQEFSAKQKKKRWWWPFGS